ncbi:alpha/beta hydrolase [Pseudaeromonas sharmana]|uniref:Alpha/beta hydrolase n=1 Tax=Pseudaeromonas sharmana TaxID=328412 RepID=A0ABV8CRB3_9GAMM
MKRALLLLSAGLMASLLLLGMIGELLSRPANHPVSMPDPAFQAVHYGRTRGSLLEADGNRLCALLLHGLHADRSSMVARARFLQQQGITSLLVDLQAHGETPGQIITFGYLESEDADNGLRYLKGEQRCQKVAVIGTSLGGASALLGQAARQADALVLESVFPRIQDAVADRIEARLGAPGRLLAPLLYLQIPLRTGIPLAKLQPIESIRHVTAPVLVIGGLQDASTKPDETRALYQAIHSPKQLWLLAGAGHVDLYRFDPAGYEQRVAAFLQRWL